MSASELVQPNARVTYGIRRENEEWLVVEKPAGVVTAPGVGHEHDTLLNGLVSRYGSKLLQIGKARDWGLVHRLDRETSGLLAVALTSRAYDALRGQFASRSVRKHYWAICVKAPKERSGVIRMPIGEAVRRIDRYRSTKRARIGGDRSKPAVTAYRTLAESPHGALIEARPISGRLHQIRLHLATIGASIAGDTEYGTGRAQAMCRRVALHAYRLDLADPISGEPSDTRASLPGDLRSLLKRLELPTPGELREAAMTEQRAAKRAAEADA